MPDAISLAPFGALKDGQQATLYTLRLDSGVSVSVTDYGASLVSFISPDQTGAFADVVLSCENAELLHRDSNYFGAVIGRVAGRISNARFSLGGRQYKLAANEGPNHLHGGKTGLGKRMWRLVAMDGNALSITFGISSGDGDEGYPGNLTASVTYQLRPPADLALTFTAIADARTPFNPTSHAYFNLDGHDAGEIANHTLEIPADHYTPIGPDLIPTGAIAEVAGTAFDFRHAKPIGSDFRTLKTGYDHNFVLHSPATGLRRGAIVKSPRSGRRLTVWTDRPCIHLYTGHNLVGALAKGRTVYRSGAGFALETQEFPDALNQPNFPSETLAAASSFSSRTIFSLGQD